MQTRTVEDCERLVLLWMRGDEEEVIKQLGGVPSDQFLEDFLPKVRNTENVTTKKRSKRSPVDR